MKLSEVQQALDVDMSWGLVYVLTIAKTAILGALIGSPIAAGVASLVVANREMESDKKMSDNIRREIQAKMLRKQWLDDPLHIRRGRLSDRAMKVVKETQKERFYGKTLRLLNAGNKEAFGFLL